MKVFLKSWYPLTKLHGDTFQKIVIITDLLNPWGKVLPGKLTGSQLVKKFPAFHGTRRFITTFTSACHLSLS
jgi:hypothetical protein